MAENSLLAASIAAKAADNKKARDIDVIDVSKITTITDYFVICSGGSETQIEAIADEIIEKMEKLGAPLLRKEGTPQSHWILLDFGGIIVHVFHEQQRKFYQLERIWADGEKVPLDI